MYPHPQEQTILTPERLGWLCRNENAETTLNLLYHLNHWAKASELLLYGDRQTLYRVKAILIEGLTRAGILQPDSYRDASHMWRDTLMVDIAANIGTEIFIDNLEFALCWHQQQRESTLQQPCPWCHRHDLAPGNERLEHAQHHHPSIKVVSAKEAAWILAVDKQQVKGHIPANQRDARNKARQWTLETLIEPAHETTQRWNEPAQLSTYESTALDLYHTMMGRKAASCEDAKATLANQVEAYIKTRVSNLVEQAWNNKEPLSIPELQRLMFTPSDLVEIAYTRFQLDWDDLGESDLWKLDPQGKSLVGFRYHSNTAHYHFHLPYRTAETFVASENLETLQTSPKQREEGEYYGRAITEAESLEIPIGRLLEALGVAVGQLFPRGLVDKRQYIAEREEERAWRHSYDDDLSDEEDETH